MNIEGYYLSNSVERLATFSTIRSREVKRGFERIRFSITDTGFKALTQFPKEMKKNLCIVYPGHPRPVPEDILSVKVEIDPRHRNKYLLTMLIKRGHYYPSEDVHPSSISRYKIEEVEDVMSS